MLSSSTVRVTYVRGEVDEEELLTTRRCKGAARRPPVPSVSPCLPLTWPLERTVAGTSWSLQPFPLGRLPGRAGGPVVTENNPPTEKGKTAMVIGLIVGIVFIAGVLYFQSKNKDE